MSESNLLDDLHAAMADARELHRRLEELADAFYLIGNFGTEKRLSFLAQEAGLIYDKIQRGTNTMLNALVQGVEQATINMLNATIAAASKKESDDG